MIAEDTLQQIIQRFEFIEAQMSEGAGDIAKLAKEYSDLRPVVEEVRAYQTLLRDISDAEAMMDDPDMRELAAEELPMLRAALPKAEHDLQLTLLPKDEADARPAILEIRPGTGGDEAALFASDLFRMYARYAEGQRWKIEVMNHNTTGVGGTKEIIAMIVGKGAYSRFKYESGTHRVQRVPVTETQGRIHTSAVTVAVLPEAEDVELHIDSSEIKVDVYRSTGPGGQSVNTTDSAVRLTHLPTGLVVTCQDEKSQLKNKNKAMKVLRARLLDQMVQEQNALRSEERKSQVGSGDRSGRIRTYNFPQGRVTDYRIGLTVYKLDAVLQGGIDFLIQELTTFYQTQALQNADADQNPKRAMDHPPAS